MEKSEKEVIYLEPDEEITSIIDKLKALKDAKSVILVVPKNASISQSVVNLKILKKEGMALKIDLGIVTHDEIGKNLSLQVGLPIYASINSEKPIMEIAKETPNLNDTIEIDMSERKPLKPPPGVKVNYYSANDEDMPERQNLDKKNIKEPMTHSMASPISTDKFSEPSLSKPKVEKKWKKKLIIILIILAVAGGLFYYFGPKAKITLAVISQPIEENIEITVDTSLKAYNNDKIIPGQIVSANQELNKSFSATGKKDVGEKAHGKINLSNGTGAIINLPSGSQIESAKGLFFVTTENVAIPAATASVDSDGNVVKNSGKASVNVEAYKGGEEYNLDPTTFTIVNFPNLSAASSDKFTGGVSKQITVISDDDIAKAKASLEDELKTSIQNALVNITKDKQLSFINDAIDYEVENYSTDKPAGTEADKFSATLKVNGKTIAFSQKDYQASIINALGSKITSDKELVLSPSDQISQGDINIDYSKGVMKINGKIKTKLAPKINTESIAKYAKGKNISQTETYIKQQNQDISSIKVSLSPSWWGRMPVKTSNIAVGIDYK